jgi:hypothetical protein
MPSNSWVLDMIAFVSVNPLQGARAERLVN